MAKRILLAGVLGGFALFVWGGLAHTVLGLGTVGLKFLPQQQPVMETLKASVPQPGFYFFPQTDFGMTLPPAEVGGPYGIMIYHVAGAGGSMAGQLVNELILNVALALLAAYLLSLATGVTGYMARVGFVTALGLIVGLMVNVQYWNWYGFPMSYTVAAIFVAVVGFLLIGLIAAALIKAPVRSIAAVPARAA
jgi:hypothetical protein